MPSPLVFWGARAEANLERALLCLQQEPAVYLLETELKSGDAMERENADVD